MYIGLGPILRKFFNFHVTEARVAMTQFAPPPSAAVCVKCHLTSANTKRALPVTSNVKRDVMFMLPQSNFLGVKPFMTVPRVCWQELSQRLGTALRAVGDTAEDRRLVSQGQGFVCKALL